MGVYLGVDFHARTQTVCWCDTSSGVIERRTLDHCSDDVRAFYQQFPVPATVGLEATGYARWFHRLIEESGHRLLVGDAHPAVCRTPAEERPSRCGAAAEPSSARRFSGHSCSLHREPGGAAAIALSPSVSRYAHDVEEWPARVLLSNRAIRPGRPRTVSWRQQLEQWPLIGADAIRREHSLALLDELTQRIQAMESELERRSENDARVARVQTHPGVGLLTSLAVVHTLEPVSRFPRTGCVAAYCGLDPIERSSGDTVRFGHISKQGNRFLRFLLVEAGHCAIARQADPDLHRFYYHLAMKKNPAVVAVARKLLLRLFCMLREEIDYDEFRRRGRDARCARSKASPLNEG